MSDWPWPPPTDDDGAAHLVPGLALPDVPLPATTGGAVSLAQVAGRAVVFVYPYTGAPGQPNPPGWDNIPGAHGSTPEALGFRDLQSDFAAHGWQIVGLSGQTPADQSAFAARAGLSYPLLSDIDGRIRRALHLPVFETGGVVYLKRLTMLVADGIIERVFYPVHPPERHASDVFADIAHARRA
ncbi:MAG: peroxiredoxin [Hyphomicrobium sp.]|nr:peroxiredoxin [Hyphomicrobium sp.]